MRFTIIAMKSTILLLALLLVTGLISCKKNPDAPTGSSRIAVSGIRADTLKASWVVVSSSVVAVGLKNITDHGFCWSINPLPDISSPHVSLGSVTDTGRYSSTITGLNSVTTYYIRSFLTDDKKLVIYGNQLVITTLDLVLPAITTMPVTNITANSAVSGGTLTSDGNGRIATRGVCWSVSGTPALNHCDGFTQDNGMTFISSMTGLIHDSTYHVTAYATNDKGTAYGDVKIFSTKLPCGAETVTLDSITYHTVLIGTQCWLKENLNVGTAINGSLNQDPSHTKTEKYCFNNLESNCTQYGGLYQWDEIMKGSIVEGVQGICPSGYHIPMDAEWTSLTTFLGGDSTAGTKMKMNNGWYNNGNGTNTSGFTGLPGGFRGNNSDFNNLTQLAMFWSSTQAGASETWNRKLSADTAAVTKYNSFKTNGFSVRCIQSQ
jgi:uncharacterized protein (TIGR02145 family)